VGRTLRDEALRLGTDVYDTGLAMHSRSRVEYALEGHYRTFEAVVGVDAKAGPRASVTVSVEIDGKSAPGAHHLCKLGDPPVSLRIPVQGARRLTLITDFGPLGGVQGHALWTDARLVKTK
jgi:hypothetical protein